jgi:uncharacterized protein
MMVDILIMKTTGKTAPEVEVGQASAARLLAGQYKTKTWNHFTGEDDRLFCGIWECTPGKASLTYDEWEFCHIISGEAVLTNDQGKSWTVAEGDAFIIPAGFSGTWETIKKLRKHYVILNPKGH